MNSHERRSQYSRAKRAALAATTALSLLIAGAYAEHYPEKAKPAEIVSIEQIKAAKLKNIQEQFRKAERAPKQSKVDYFYHETKKPSQVVAEKLKASNLGKPQQVFLPWMAK